MKILKPVDLLVAGSGLAGMSAALHTHDIAPDSTFFFCTKSDEIESGSTLLSQGGIAAALDAVDMELHFSDTMQAGSNLCNREALGQLVSRGLDLEQHLVKSGVPLDRDSDGRTARNREGGHSSFRILKSRGDSIGKALTLALKERLQDNGITTRTACMLWKLITSGQGTSRQIAGALLLDATEGVLYLPAKSAILATGGWGRVYQTTTNPVESTGDSIAIAAETGLPLSSMAFMQFHPTALETVRGESSTEEPRLLLTEALRGAGAVLIDVHGRHIFQQQEDNLAPRDLVSRKVWNAQLAGQKVFLDCRMIENLADRFPSVHCICREADINPEVNPVPVIPVAHYSIGGIRAGYDGTTALPGLFAAGEAACTGVHGANRLAGNSLLECIVFGRLAAEKALQYGRGTGLQKTMPAIPEKTTLPEDEAAAVELIHGIREVTGRWLGIIRTQSGLREAVKVLRQLRTQHLVTLTLSEIEKLDTLQLRRRIEAVSLLESACAAARDAAGIKESVGVHYIEKGDMDALSPSASV